LAPELSALCTLRKTQDLNDQPLLSMSLADNFYVMFAFCQHHNMHQPKPYFGTKQLSLFHQVYQEHLAISQEYCNKIENIHLDICNLDSSEMIISYSPLAEFLIIHPSWTYCLHF